MVALKTIIFWLFIAFLFWQDRRRSSDVPIGLWIPFVWMFLIGSRYVSSWLDLRPIMNSAQGYADGSPIDRLVFLTLIVLGVAVLVRRKIDWRAFNTGNILLISYFLYTLVSITWADDSFVTFKRWIKDLGNPIMVMIILTSPDPKRALGTTLRRLSFVFLPLSVLFVKYYPELGRLYHNDGTPMFIGIGHQKNDLGLMCLVAGMYYAWQIIVDRQYFLSWSRVSKMCTYVLLVMLGWLLYISNSQTSLACLLTAIAIFVAYKIPAIERKPQRLFTLLVGSVAAYFVLESAFGIREWILELLGRDATLTDRTDLWNVVLNIGPDSVLFGSGFMSFWSFENTAEVARQVGVALNQAHNGYIEQFLNLGYIGVGLISLLLIQALFRARVQLKVDASLGAFRLSLLLAALLYNYTEASFYGLNNMWLLTLMAMYQVPKPAIEAMPATTPGLRIATPRS